MHEAIQLRIITWRSKSNKFRAVCLETNLFFQAESEHDLVVKMKDGIKGYLDCFTEAEIASGDYIRPAPLKYRVIWFIKPLLSLINSYKSKKANYNFTSGKLKFA